MKAQDNVTSGDRYIALVADLVKAVETAEKARDRAEQAYATRLAEVEQATAKGLTMASNLEALESEAKALEKARGKVEEKARALRAARDKGTALQEDALSRGVKYSGMLNKAREGLAKAAQDYTLAIIFEGGITFSGRARMRAMAYPKFILKGDEVFGVHPDGETHIRIARKGEWAKVSSTVDTSLAK